MTPLTPLLNIQLKPGEPAVNAPRKKRPHFLSLPYFDDFLKRCALMSWP